MKAIFVDAENVGLKELEKINATIVDKVFVFSKSDAVKLVCQKSLYHFLGDYPTGPNQADFYIIAYLSRVLLALDKKQLGSTHFELYSNDESLITAFEFQCDLLGSSCQSIRTREQTVVSLIESKPKKSKKLTPEERVLNALTSPQSLNPNFQKKVGLSQSDFSKAITELSKNKQIKRSPQSKKKWVSC
ncbi:hypothetical protein CWO17_11410 [Vibrio sp. 10N.286.45.A3]|jgi:uncharacterized protein YueI|uniref:hypothetical protein n=1 Tax=Vibrio TaxID=662 RepID=UPI000C82268E|nr:MULTISPECIES: hypothetical protein [Vibrio]MBS9939245.1 hypothetical protein [Vibrio alginolyticus]PMH09490.1 hypothetical protein BCU75_14270 [Vibrio splendidus]PTP05025.1 hypothetical protein CWO17_11410 [Vibrio sp. 10N.286.45.A3]TKE74768.1 hypothetical protein FCV56_23075 [Vibrio sp. F12]TKE96223.1 hypothetical protein FCV61_16330 [Vibrio sp. F12]